MRRQVGTAQGDVRHGYVDGPSSVQLCRKLKKDAYY